MKRSYINLITVILIFIEIIFAFYSLNEMYVYINQTLQTKYVVVMIIAYMASSVFTMGYWIHYPELDSTRKIDLHLSEVYKYESFNFIYTYHFIVFAALCFFCNNWPFLIMSVIMFAVWNYVRVSQNERADAHNLEVAKENAKKKPTVVLND